MRVTLVVNRHDTVSETFQRALAVGLADAGHEVTVHALRTGPAPAAHLARVRTTTALPAMRARSAAATLGRLALGSEPGLAVAARRAWARYGATGRAVRAALYAGPIVATRPDVVHLGFSGLGVALADALPLLEGVRLVVSCRGTDELVRPLLDPDRAASLRALLGGVDRIHAVADAVRDAVVALGAPADRVRVVRPAVDLDRWPPRQRPPGRAHLDLVAVARLEPAKGLDDLVAAVAMVRAAGVDTRLRIVGDGRHRDALRLRIERTGLAGVVHLVGVQPPEMVREELVGADVFVSASLSEGINNGVLEAMATSLPVISTDVGGMAEVIVDGRDGWLVAPGRPDLLTAALQVAHGDPAGRDAVAAAGRRRVEAGFGLARQRAEMAALYLELGDGTRPPAARIARREGRT